MTDPAGLTPMMRQYRELKARYPDHLLLFRLGDFYELFLEDAERGARLLQITLTSRQDAPMAGIPYHAAETYIARLIRAGQKVAICEQLEAPGRGKKLLRRDVVRVITPGTVTDTAFLEGAANNFLLALVQGRDRMGLALVDVSTGEFSIGEGGRKGPATEGGRKSPAAEGGRRSPAAESAAASGGGLDLLDTALWRRPSEVLLPSTLRDDAALCATLAARGAVLTFCDPAMFASGSAADALCAHFGVATLDAFGIGDLDVGLQAAAGVLAYLRETQGQGLGHLTRLQRLLPAESMTIDETAAETLELFPTVFATVNRTATPMGARLLRQWLQHPLLDPARIHERQDAVEALVDAPAARERVRRLLRGIGDIERLTSRAAMGAAHARDLVGLRASLRPLDDLHAALEALLSAPGGRSEAPEGRSEAPEGRSEAPEGLAAADVPDATAATGATRGPVPLERARADLTTLASLRVLLQDALADEPPLLLHEGGLIRPGWNEALTAVVEGAREAREWIGSLEARERARTGLSTLRVRFNRVFGYGIEVSRTQAERVPADYVRRQTLTGAERYVTAELKEHEAKVLGAEERARRLEYGLFVGIREAVSAEARDLMTTARAVALVDALASLAEIAHARGHTRPLVDEGVSLEIVDGRHPVLEAQADRQVTPNDLSLDAESSVVILTGPNMSGKSVYLRQTALLCLLAQVGAFIPARRARIGIVDRIFTRVGAQDSLAAGRSTFLVEMVETASILHNVTARSLVLLDEVGRGTSTFDGLAIAWAVVEALHDHGRGAKVLFATHFHELTRLAERLPRVRNFHVAVREWNDEIVFLHKVLPGGADRSYGIQVARLAGLPRAVLERARTLLAELETARAGQIERADAAQLGLFDPPPHPVLEELEKLDVSRLTPLDALNIVADWQRRVAPRGHRNDPRGHRNDPRGSSE